MKKLVKNYKRQIKVQRVSLRNSYVFFNAKDLYSALIICLLLIFFAHQGIAQKKHITMVTMKPANPSWNNNSFNKIKEEKRIEFFIIGMNGQEDLWTIEDLLTYQTGIDRSRISGDIGFCTVITLMGSNIGEEFIKTLLESKGFGIQKYSERWINKPTGRVGEKCFIQNTPKSNRGSGNNNKAKDASGRSKEEILKGKEDFKNHDKNKN